MYHIRLGNSNATGQGGIDTLKKTDVKPLGVRGLVKK